MIVRPRLAGFFAAALTAGVPTVLLHGSALASEAPSIDSAPADASSDDTPEWAFSGEPGATFDCELSGPEGFVESAPGCTSPYSVDLTEAPDGVYTFSVTQTPEGGEPSGASQDAYELDRVAPARPVLISGPPARTADATPTVDWEDGAGITYSCEVRRGAMLISEGACASPATFDLTASDDGAFTIAITPSDAAGNAGEPLEAAFILDTTGPFASPFITAAPASPSRSRYATWRFTPGSSDPMQCRLDLDGAVAFDWHTCTSPKTYDLGGMPSGTYSFSVRHVDEVGNPGVALTAGDYVYDREPARIRRLRSSRDPFRLSRHRSTVIGFGVNEPGRAWVVIKHRTQRVRGLGAKQVNVGTRARFRWDGRNASGHRVRPGRYVAVVTMRDLAGNVTRERLTLTVKP